MNHLPVAAYVNRECPASAGGEPVRPAGDFLIFGQPVLSEAEIELVGDVLRSRWIGLGPRVHEFETKFAAYRRVDHAVAVSSCTAALHLAMLALDIGPGDEVVTTALTFCATINAVLHAGATPVLADPDFRTMNLTAAAISERITARTKAILVVHMCGRPCDMPDIMALARRHDLRVIEDCAHAIEATIDGKPVGTFGDLGCFSFYATKNLTTAEGGMLVTDDEDVANRIRVLALHGLSKDAWRRFSDSGYQHYDVVSLGFKYNMTDVQAALGLCQLEKIETYARRRSEIWSTYESAFADLPCALPIAPRQGVVHAHHLYTPLLDLERLDATRDDILGALHAENIGAGVHYLAITRFSYYQKALSWRGEDVPNAEAIGERTLSLPLSGGLSDRDVNDVCRAFRRILLYYRR